jgi:hypothetical protein
LGVVLFALSRRYIAPFIIFSSQGSAKREKKGILNKQNENNIKGNSETKNNKEKVKFQVKIQRY